jgi:hypothetical protein
MSTLTKQRPLPSAPSQMSPRGPTLPLIIDQIDASTENVDTGLLFLAPDLLQSLRQIAPKRRRGKVRYIVGLAIFANLIAFAAEKSTRNAILARLRETPAIAATNPRASGASFVAPPMPTIDEAAIIPLPTDSAAPAPTAAAPAPKKTTRRAGPLPRSARH